MEQVWIEKYFEQYSWIEKWDRLRATSVNFGKELGKNETTGVYWRDENRTAHNGRSLLLSWGMEIEPQ